MKIELNQEKNVMFSLPGKLLLTGDKPVQDIDISSLTDKEKIALVFNHQRGVVKVEDVATIQKSITPKQEKPKVQLAPITKGQLFQAKVEEERRELSSLLSKPLNTLKKELPLLSPGKLSKLRGLELTGKNRSSILSVIDSLLEKHEKSVTSKVGKVSASTSVDNKELYKGMDSLQLDNITDVVESEVTTVEVPIDPPKE